MPCIITPHLENILKKYKDTELTKGKNPIKLDIRIINRLLEWKWTLQYKTAVQWQETLNEHSWEIKSLEEYFIVSELKWQERKRELVIEWREQMTDEDWISIVRYVFEKKFEAFSVKDILYFLFFLGLIIFIIVLIVR